MSIFKKNLEKNAVKKTLNEIQINLENNYKDLAIKAYNDAAALIETYRADKKLNDKEYEKYKQELAVFHKRMEGYSHRLNVKYLDVMRKKRAAEMRIIYERQLYVISKKTDVILCFTAQRKKRTSIRESG